MSLFNRHPYNPVTSLGPAPRTLGYVGGGLGSLLDAHLGSHIENMTRKNKSDKLSVNENGDFEYDVDIRTFRSDELKVDLDDNDLLIQAQHEANNGHKHVTRIFTRRVHIPQNIQKDSVQCERDKDGHLKITGYVAKSEEPKGKIPIHHAHMYRF